MLDELEKNGLEKVEEGYDYLLSMSFMSYTKEKIKELKQERAGKEKELDALNQANSREIIHQSLDIAEEAPKKKAPTKRTAASPLPQRANKKRLER
nr:hypothetical protein [Tanacetum cinerariifolium]